MNVTVYGRAECTKCDWTKRWLDKLGVDYEYVDIDGDRAADLLEQGDWTALPIVLVDHPSYTDQWCDFRLDKIKGLQHAF